MPKLNYSTTGDNYDTKDPAKKLAQSSAKSTARELVKKGFSEVADTRGESAFVWRQGSVYMASVIEGLGTKNLVADEMHAKFPGKNYYSVIGHDTVATIINDLITVGASPLVVHAYWAIGDNEWLADKGRLDNLISGWEYACRQSGATWGGGETPTLKGIIPKEAIDLGGSAVGIIRNSVDLVTDKKLKIGDRILLLKSNGVNTNGISLIRAIAKKLPKGLATKVTTYNTLGELVLTQTNIYARLIGELQKAGVYIHYISNITGHGMRKIMRAKPKLSYIIDDIFEPQDIFKFIQCEAKLSDQEMYGTFNMGSDYAIFVPEKDVARALKIIAKNGHIALNAGVVEKGPKQVVIRPKNIVFDAASLDLR